MIIERWGSIPLASIKNRECDNGIILDDLGSFMQMTQHVVKYISEENGYITVESDGLRGRVKSSLFQPRKRKPVAFINDPVKFYNSKGSLEFGVVRDFWWHTNRDGYLFRVEVNGKLKTRWYEEKDLELDL